MHEENDLCERYKKQLKEHPEWMKEATDMMAHAGRTALIQTQALNSMAKVVNKVIGTNLTYEGTNQVVRDIQVFAKLNSDSFSKSRVFANAQSAKEYYNLSPQIQEYVKKRLNGTAQEVDWLRSHRGSLKNLFEKASLPDGNTVGYDGLVQSRLNGNTIELVSVKAGQGASGLNTNAKDLVEAIKKGTLPTNQSAFVTEGTKDKFHKLIDAEIARARENGDMSMVRKLTDAKKNLKITEHGTTTDVVESTERLTKKIQNGKADPTITADIVCDKMVSGAVIGAAISLTVSSLTSFMRYKNGEISKEEAFTEVGEETLKGALVGGAMGGISLYLSVVGGTLAFVGSMAISIYINAVTGNILDEIFGKGAYEEMLHAEGYVLGTAKNIEEMLEEFRENALMTEQHNKRSRKTIQEVKRKQIVLEKEKSKLNDLLEGM